MPIVLLKNSFKRTKKKKIQVHALMSCDDTHETRQHNYISNCIKAITSNTIFSPRTRQYASQNFSSHLSEALELDPSAEKKVLGSGQEGPFAQHIDHLFSDLRMISKRLGQAPRLMLLFHSARQQIQERLV